MGLITSTSKNNMKKNKVPAALKKALELQHQRVVKLLLYGPGEAGKTTILRQMRLASGDPLDEMEKFRGMICMNVIEGAAATIRAGRRFFDKKFEGNPHAKLILEKYSNFARPGTDPFSINLNDSRLVEAITKICQDDDFKFVLDRRNEYQIPECWDYFVHKLSISPGWPEWGGPEWSPDHQDFLHSRIRSTGRSYVNFEIDGNMYQLIDIGGQRTERKKFFNMFSTIDAVLFVASLSEYDQFLFEDGTVNRFTETIRVWENTVNNVNFTRSWFVLFFNKLDLFLNKFKVKGVPIAPEFAVHRAPPQPSDDDAECSKALKWYEELFLSKVKDSKRHQVRVYKTTALDQKNIKEVMEYCTTILQHNIVGAM